MTGEPPRDLLIPFEVVGLLRGILARCLDRGEGATDEDRRIARLELVGAMDVALGTALPLAPETRAKECR